MNKTRRRLPVLQAAILIAAFSFAAGAIASTDFVAAPASLLAGVPPVTDSEGWIVRASASDFQAVDATPVRGLAGDWARYSPRPGRNLALRAARAEFAAARRGWEVAAVLRADVSIDGSRGAWDAVHDYRQRRTPADGTRYDVTAQEQGLIWAGLRGARGWTLKEPDVDGAGRIQLTTAATLLSLQRVQNVSARGSVGYDSAGGYGFDAQILRQDSRRSFGGWGEAGTRGRGVTADLGLRWQPTATSFVNLSLADLVARLRIAATSTEETTVSSSTRSLDGDGYVVYQPLLTGRYSAQDLRPRPARQWVANAGTRLPGSTALAGLRWERTRGLDLPAVWMALPLIDGLVLQVDAETRFRSIGLGLAGRHGALMLRTRSLPVGGSHALGWSASVTLPL